MSTQCTVLHFISPSKLIKTSIKRVLLLSIQEAIFNMHKVIALHSIKVTVNSLI